MTHVVKHESCCLLLSNKDSYNEYFLVLRMSHFLLGFKVPRVILNKATEIRVREITRHRSEASKT
jgi:hypothetical protein